MPKLRKTSVSSSVTIQKQPDVDQVSTDKPESKSAKLGQRKVTQTGFDAKISSELRRNPEYSLQLPERGIKVQDSHKVNTQVNTADATLPAPAEKLTSTLQSQTDQYKSENLSTVKVTAVDDYAGEFTREKIGGKGAALKLLQDANIPAPHGVSIPLEILQSFEQQPLDIQELKKFIPDIVNLKLAELSITSIKNAILDFFIEDPIKKDQYLQGLEKFISSEEFYQQVKDLPSANYIREAHETLNKSLNNEPIIVRSSGILEDSLGNAQYLHGY